ncbi:MAG: hypothetical protein AB7I30_20110 [Isosphaeraceae bacterium]
MRLVNSRRGIERLGLASAVLAMSLVLIGCGGSGTESSDAVVVTEPGANVSAAPSGAAASAAPGTGASGTTAATSPAATPVKAEGWGTLKGQVVFGAAAPKQDVLVQQGAPDTKDPTVCAKDAPILSERLVVDEASKGVKNVLVYFNKPTAVNEEAKSAASQAQVVFDQEKCVFEPHVLGMMAGTTITLKSSDPVNHNVNARLKSNAQFNSLLAGGATLPFSPASPERQPAQVTCDIHPWMQAWWMVLDHPYFAVTDAQGNFEIKNAPAGSQKVVVWQESTSFVTSPQGEDVVIAANETTTKDFTIDPGKVKK